MLLRNEFQARFGERAVFGMVHLKPLPGAPEYSSLDVVIDSALRDARAIAAGGAAGMLFENFGDRPFTKGRAEAETVAAMARVIAEVAREVKLPFGVNVLRNDPLSALGIAASTGASFIRVNVHSGAMVTDQGIIEGDAYSTLRKRAALAPGVLIFADFRVKHATPLGEVSPRELRDRAMADAIIITGAATGAPADPAMIAELREQVEAPIVVGSGLTPENAATYRDADGAIIGTSVKEEGRVDVARVRRVVEAFGGFGGFMTMS